jgi:hypothetical protein
MEPLDDRELSQVLREWKAPATPPHLRAPRQPSRRPSWWRWLMTGTIRIPVPVGLALVALLAAVWMYSITRREPVVGTQPSVNQPVVSLADFQPVREVEVRVVGDVR